MLAVQSNVGAPNNSTMQGQSTILLDCPQCQTRMVAPATGAVACPSCQMVLMAPSVVTSSESKMPINNQVPLHAPSAPISSDRKMPINNGLQGSMKIANGTSKKFIVYQLQLQPAQAAYFPGQYVKGQLIIHPKKEYKARDVKIRISGRVYTRVRYTSGSGKKKKRKTARQTVTLFQTRIVVWGGAGLLQPQQYTFPFNFIVPNVVLPSSYEGGWNGNIRYFVDCNVNTAWKKDPRIFIPITVLEYIDINHSQYIRPSLNMEGVKKLGCCCCESGPLTLNCYLDHTAYSPGESMVLSWGITNNTGKDLGGFIATLQRRTQFRARNHRRVQIIKVFQETVKATIPMDFNDVDNSTELKIPSIPPTINSPTLTTSYFLNLTVTVPYGINLTRTIQLVIGTSQRLAQPPPEVNRKVSHALPPPTFDEGPDSNWEPPPPAYLAADEPGNINDLDNFVISGTAPTYPPPTFNNNVSWNTEGGGAPPPSYTMDADSADTDNIAFAPTYPVYKTL